MTIWKALWASTFLVFFLACGDDDPSRGFRLDTEPGGKRFQVGNTIAVSVKNRTDREADSVSYFLDEQRLDNVQGRLTLQAGRLGEKTLRAEVFSEGETIRLEKEIELLAARAPEIYTYEVIQTYPHDRDAFTQGLEFRGDTLYESTGQKGASSLRKVDFRTGEVLARVDLDRQYFGEGITILGDTLYMLTWQNGNGFMYDPETLDPIGSFAYGESREGWGLCNDGQRIFKSDGTQRIWLLDPRTLEETGHIETVTDKSVFNKANELEYVDGKIYANVWQRPSMMIINAASGAIEGVVNFSGLENQVTQHEQLDVFNGVAYHPGRQTFFVTGKRWDKLFEVRILKRTP